MDIFRFQWNDFVDVQLFFCIFQLLKGKAEMNFDGFSNDENWKNSFRMKIFQ